MAETYETLLSSAKCFTCIPPGMSGPIIVYLLGEILKNYDRMADTSYITLLSNAKCYTCIPPGMMNAIIIYLLNQIMENGTGSGITCGTVNPTTAPTGTCGLYYRTDTGDVWFWNGTVWVLLIGS